MEVYEVPALNFKLSCIEWNPNGSSIALFDKDKFCIGFPVGEFSEYEDDDENE